jgi:hypothetical protein
MEAYLEKMEAHLEEMKSVAMHKEVPKEEAAVKTVRALKEQYGDWHLIVEYCRQLKKWTQGNGGSQKKLATACKGMTCCAGVARCKGCGHTELTEKVD